MRLLNKKTLEFRTFFGDAVPKYVIASHRWCEDEPTFHTFQAHKDRNSKGYQKVIGFCRVAEQYRPKAEWLWIDTCCIDKSNSVELNETIVSMFKWYKNADMCFAWLHDFHYEGVTIGPEFQAKLRSCVWFSRGWTLQELLAPPHVIFLNWNWGRIGHKTCTVGKHFKMVPYTTVLELLDSTIASVTGIPYDVLGDFSSSKQLSVEERLSWLTGRSTTRPEDLYYSMLGIFGVYMLPIYGEGGANAKRRLLKEIRDLQDSSQDVKDDHSNLRSKSEPGLASSSVAEIPFQQVRGLAGMATLSRASQQARGLVGMGTVPQALDLSTAPKSSSPDSAPASSQLYTPPSRSFLKPGSLSRNPSNPELVTPDSTSPP